MIVTSVLVLIKVGGKEGHLLPEATRGVVPLPQKLVRGRFGQCNTQRCYLLWWSLQWSVIDQLDFCTWMELASTFRTAGIVVPGRLVTIVTSIAVGFGMMRQMVIVT